MKSLAAGSNSVLANDATDSKCVEVSADLSSYYTHTEVNNLLNTKQDEMGLLNDNTRIQLLNTNNVLQSLSAGSNSVLATDATNNNFVDLAANLPA